MLFIFFVCVCVGRGEGEGGAGVYMRGGHLGPNFFSMSHFLRNLSYEACNVLLVRTSFFPELRNPPTLIFPKLE